MVADQAAAQLKLALVHAVAVAAAEAVSAVAATAAAANVEMGDLLMVCCAPDGVCHHSLMNPVLDQA